MTDEPQTAVGEAVERLAQTIISDADRPREDDEGPDRWNLSVLCDNHAADLRTVLSALSSVSERERGLVEALRSAEASLTEIERDHPRWMNDADLRALARARSALQSMKGE